MSHTPSIHYLHHYQKALSVLPEETAVYVVEGYGEVFGVYLDRAAATLWIAIQPNSLDYAIRAFSLIRKGDAKLSYLRPGEPLPVEWRTKPNPRVALPVALERDAA